MKITTFDPMIVSPEADEVITLFEGLGFEKRHNVKGTNDNSDYATARLKHPEGYNVDVIRTAAVPRDMTAIRMNVDDLEETVKLLMAHGFVDANGGKVTDLGSSQSVFMMSPSGFCISVVKHIRNHD
jgi:hypothetical protein